MKGENLINQLLKAGMTYDQAWLFVESGLAQDYIDQLTLYDNTAKFAKYPRGISKKTRFDVFKRDGFRCRVCGKGAKDGVTLEIDHINPISKGGTNDTDNLWVLCFDCNRGKGDKVIPAQILSDCARMVTG